MRNKAGQCKKIYEARAWIGLGGTRNSTFHYLQIIEKLLHNFISKREPSISLSLKENILRIFNSSSMN